MLVATTTAGFGAGLGAVMPELVDLKKEIARCIKAFPLSSSGNVDADIAITCQFKVDGSNSDKDGIRPFEKVTLLEAEDNTTLFDIVRTLLTQWRNTDMGSKPSNFEARTRRIAAQKLGEESVYDAVSPTLAVQTLSSAGRIERDESVIVPILVGIGLILGSRDVPDSVRTEAITTLKAIADPLSGFLPGTQVTAQQALLVAQANKPKPAPTPPTPPPTPTPPGPTTVTPAQKSRSPYTVPVVATLITAVAAGGALWAFYRHRTAAYATSAVALARRRARARSRRH